MLKLDGFWYIAAASRELGKGPIRRVVESEVLVLFRDGSGRPHALIDRCAHRGMALSRGRMIDGCIQCPYHGWEYDGSGTVRCVPALCEGEPLPQPKSMRSYPLVEQDDHLWVWIGTREPDAGPFRFPHFGERDWTTFFMQTRFEAPVDACLENFLDVPHTLFVHPGLFRGASQKETTTRLTRRPDGVEVEFVNERPLQGMGPRLFFPRNTSMRHTDRFILPSITRVDYEFGRQHAFIITSQCTQRAELIVDVTTAITWRLPVPRWLARPFARLYCRRVIRQDVKVLKVQGQQWRQFGRCIHNTSADLLGVHIRRLRQNAAEGVPADASTAEVLQERVIRI